jgi:hypothetical protein
MFFLYNSRSIHKNFYSVEHDAVRFGKSFPIFGGPFYRHLSTGS